MYIGVLLICPQTEKWYLGIQMGQDPWTDKRQAHSEKNEDMPWKETVEEGDIGSQEIQLLSWFHL